MKVSGLAQDRRAGGVLDADVRLTGGTVQEDGAGEVEGRVLPSVDERGSCHVGGGTEDGGIASPVRMLCTLYEPREGRDGENWQNESHR